MKEGEGSAALKPADGQIFIIFAPMGPGKPTRIFKEHLSGSLKSAPALAHPEKAAGAWGAQSVSRLPSTPETRSEAARGLTLSPRA